LHLDQPYPYLKYNMASPDTSNEKAQLTSAMTKGLPESLSNSESDHHAMVALEKRVPRKTDMVVLPMVNLPVQLFEMVPAYNVS